MLTHGRLKLRLAINLLVIMTLLSTALVNWITSAYALKNTLTDSYLENNYKYASRLSVSTSDLFHHMQDTMNELSIKLGKEKMQQEDFDEYRLLLENYFNTIFIVNPDAVIELISPSVLQFQQTISAGYQFETAAVKEAIRRKQPYISEPYKGATGHQVVIVSAPIFDNSGNYKGLVAGAIFLDSQDNAFNNLLENNLYKDGSLVYVVDQSGHIIYHPDSNRINRDVSKNYAVKQILLDKSGAEQTEDRDGDAYFTAYVHEKNKGWGIISQTPASIINEPLADLFKKIAFQSFPMVLLILVVAQFLTNNLIKPLNRLAKFSEDAIDTKKEVVPLQTLQIKSHIYEIHQLYHQIYNHFELLNSHIQLDGLTGLANRRTFNNEINDCALQKKVFSLILIDIDNFKKINDTYGHLVGDDTLKYLSCMIREVAGEGDLCFRYGGEEFCILSREKGEGEAWQLAEKLRTLVAKTVSPTGKPITISLGISSVYPEDACVEAVIKRSDMALYHSKNAGKNRTTIYVEKQNLA